MKKNVTQIAVMVICFVVLAVPQVAPCSVIYVSGNVSGVWSADTVIVTSDIQIPTGASLFIQTGVEVYFEGYYKMVVSESAILMAVGSVSDSISFNESWYWPNNGWHGIRFLSASSSSRMEYCHMTNGYAWGSGGDEHGGAIYCNNSSPQIRHCLIDSCVATASGGAIYCDSNSQPVISYNTIQGNTCWDYGGSIYLGSYSMTTVNNNQIIGNTAWDYGSGIYCGSFSEPQIIENNILDNVALDYAGGVYCGSNSTVYITGNTISGNVAAEYGGGIYCGTMSNPIISGNDINLNSANYGGGIYCASNSDPEISDNILSINDANAGGGLYCGTYSYPQISNNTVDGNTGIDGGGMHFSDSSTPSILENVIKNNSAVDGGGLYFHSSHPTIIELNELSANLASESGGGIYLIFSDPTFNKNTITADTATVGGGIYSVSSNPVMNNCIVWSNFPDDIHQISGSNLQATYSDIGFVPVWPGIGNINEAPMFVSVATGDYHLQWGSPCIDSGNPSSTYNDPDGTRADMGCYFFDQGDSNQIDLELTYLSGSPVPAGGGNLIFDLYLENIGSDPLDFDAWIDIAYEGGPPTTVIQRIFANYQPGFTVIRNGMFFPIPGSYAGGNYTFTGKAGSYPNTVWVQSGFPFVKSGTADNPNFQPFPIAGAPNPFCDEPNAELSTHDNETALSAYPNPFNPSTTIHFSLERAENLNLTVYDIMGRQVQVLADGHFEAGEHTVNFDGTGLSSGVYIYKLSTPGFTKIAEMVLAK